MEQKNNELSISLKCMKEVLEQTREGTMWTWKTKSKFEEELKQKKSKFEESKSENEKCKQKLEKSNEKT